MTSRWTLPVSLAAFALFALPGASASCTSTSKAVVGDDGASDASAGETGADAGPSPTCGDSGTKTIQASSYDQACGKDSDCVAVGEGNACAPCGIVCTSAAISTSAYAQYVSDVGTRPAAAPGESCAANCPAEFGPCCRAGSCHADLQCSSPEPTDGAAADGAGADAGSDACGGACGQGQTCVHLGTSPASGGPVCAGSSCGTSVLDGGPCPSGETCQTVSYDPCPPPAPGQASCNIASVTYQACVADMADASAE